jgi:hypothetical protein
MITGSLTLNGLDDKDMQLIFEMRAKTPLLFNPSGTTIRTKQQQSQGTSKPITTSSWVGLKAADWRR